MATVEVSPAADGPKKTLASDDVLVADIEAKNPNPCTAAYVAMLATKADGWMHVLNMLALCTALILACAYTGLSWFGSAVKELTQCGRWDHFGTDLAWMIQFGLGELIMCLFGSMGLNALTHGGNADKGVVCSRAWKRYFPFFLLNLLGVIVLFILVAQAMVGMVGAQQACQHELWITEMGSTTFCEKCVAYNVAREAVEAAAAAGASAGEIDALMPEAWTTGAYWSIWDDGGGPVCWGALVPGSGLLTLAPLLWVNRRRRR